VSAKLPTIKEIAKRLNVSISTVSRALHEHPSIGLGTKMRVQELAKELNYEPNQTAIFFQQGKTFTLGVILPDLSLIFLLPLVALKILPLRTIILFPGLNHTIMKKRKKRLWRL